VKLFVIKGEAKQTFSAIAVTIGRIGRPTLHKPSHEREKVMKTTTRPTATRPGHLMELFAERAAAADLEGLIELYEPDAVFEPAFGATVVGHDQLRQALPEFLQLRPQIRYTTEPDVVVIGDIALVTNFWTMVGTAPDGSEVGEGGISADVCRRRSDGSWGVLIDQPRGEPTI
jgi:uncharacterized protein (TIGR02246 family)